MSRVEESKYSFFPEELNNLLHCVFCQKILNNEPTYLTCSKCPNYFVCTQCNNNHKHDHRMNKSGILMVIDDGESQLCNDIGEHEIYRVTPEEKRENVIRCLETLVHAVRCVGDNCRSGPCIRMKRVINHSLRCQGSKNQELSCPVCKQFLTLLKYHASDCTNISCDIPQCPQIKGVLESIRLQQQSS